MIPRTYEILRRAVEEGAAYGVNRAHKYADAPSRDTIAAAVTEAVMGSIAEVFEFPEPPTPAPILTREERRRIAEAEYIYAALAAKPSSSAPSAEGPHAPAAPVSPGEAGSGRAPWHSVALHGPVETSTDFESRLRYALVDLAGAREVIRDLREQLAKEAAERDLAVRRVAEYQRELAAAEAERVKPSDPGPCPPDHVDAYVAVEDVGCGGVVEPEAYCSSTPPYSRSGTVFLVRIPRHRAMPPVIDARVLR